MDREKLPEEMQRVAEILSKRPGRQFAIMPRELAQAAGVDGRRIRRLLEKHRDALGVVVGECDMGYYAAMGQEAEEIKAERIKTGRNSEINKLCDGRALRQAQGPERSRGAQSKAEGLKEEGEGEDAPDVETEPATAPATARLGGPEQAAPLGEEPPGPPATSLSAEATTSSADSPYTVEVRGPGLLVTGTVPRELARAVAVTVLRPWATMAEAKMCEKTSSASLMHL